VSNTGTTWSKISELKKKRKLGELSDLELNEMLMKIYILIGLRKQHQPSNFELKVLLEYLRENYSKYAGVEIQVAFKLAVKGKLDIDSVNPYDQFSIPYFEKIMQGYRKFVNQAFEDEPDPIPVQLPYTISKEEKLQEIESYRNSTLRTSLLPPYLYDWIMEFNLVELSDDEKSKMYGKATKIRQSELYDEAMERGDFREYKRFMKLKADHFKDIQPTDTASIEFIYRRLIVKKYYGK
jgi:hypothetical protein